MNIVRIVGVSFVRSYPQILYTVLEAVEATRQGAAQNGIVVQVESGAEYISNDDPERHEGPTALLMRNPQNPYDSNAIEVHVPSVGMIGHIPRGLAAHLAPLLDSGTQILASVYDVPYHPDHPERPGCLIELGVKDSLPTLGTT